MNFHWRLPSNNLTIRLSNKRQLVNNDLLNVTFIINENFEWFQTIFWWFWTFWKNFSQQYKTDIRNTAKIIRFILKNIVLLDVGLRGCQLLLVAWKIYFHIVLEFCSSFWLHNSQFRKWPNSFPIIFWSVLTYFPMLLLTLSVFM